MQFPLKIKWPTKHLLCLIRNWPVQSRRSQFKVIFSLSPSPSNTNKRFHCIYSVASVSTNVTQFVLTKIFHVFLNFLSFLLCISMVNERSQIDDRLHNPLLAHLCVGTKRRIGLVPLFHSFLHFVLCKSTRIGFILELLKRVPGVIALTVIIGSYWRLCFAEAIGECWSILYNTACV